MSRVVLIGGGVVGAAIAYELSQAAGLSVTLLEQDQPAAGATGAALGIVMGVISQKTRGRAWRLREMSLRRYQTLLPELEASGQRISHNCQGIMLLGFEQTDWGKWEQLAMLRHSQGWPLELWSREQVLARCPQLAGETLTGAVYSPQDLQVHPTALTQALLTAAQANGVTCRFGVSALDVTTHEQTCTRLQTSHGELELDWLVIAAGLGSLPLTAKLRKLLSLRPVLGQALHLRLPQPLGDLNFQPVITGEDVHLVPLGGGDYWVGATVEFPDATGEVAATPALLEQVRQDAITFCPALADAEILRTWSGKRPRPEGQAAPVIGKLPGYRNVLLATGHYRNGVLLAPATAQIIRQTLETQ